MPVASAQKCLQQLLINVNFLKAPNEEGLFFVYNSCRHGNNMLFMISLNCLFTVAADLQSTSLFKKWYTSYNLVWVSDINKESKTLRFILTMSFW